jgi:DNA-binding MarR family transcriptional regulator
MTSDSYETLQRSLTQVVRGVSVPRFHERVIGRAAVEIDRVEAIALSRIVDSESMRLTELANQMGVACSTAGRHAAHLEERGLVHRSVDPSDARGIVVTATTAGVALVSDLRGAYRELLSELMCDWDPVEVRGFAVMLTRLADDLTRHPVEVQL